MVYGLHTQQIMKLSKKQVAGACISIAIIITVIVLNVII